MKKLTVYVSSQVGCVRTNNEDIILAGAGIYRDEDWRGEGILLSPNDKYLVAVCDGMGGQNAGEVASEDDAVQLREFVSELPAGMSHEQLLKDIIEWHDAEHEYLLHRGLDEKEVMGMGTTLVSLFYYEDRIYVLNCGDSRLYRFRDGLLEQISHDHSMYSVTGKVEDCHIITNCIGGGCERSFIDIEDITASHHAGDLYLMCSDGLTDMVSDQKIRDILITGGRSRELTNAACEAGGFDNVSVCIVELN